MKIEREIGTRVWEDIRKRSSIFNTKFRFHRLSSLTAFFSLTNDLAISPTPTASKPVTKKAANAPTFAPHASELTHPAKSTPAKIGPKNFITLPPKVLKPFIVPLTSFSTLSFKSKLTLLKCMDAKVRERPIVRPRKMKRLQPISPGGRELGMKRTKGIRKERGP